MTGGPRKTGWRAAGAALALGIALVLEPPPAQAQGPEEVRAALLFVETWTDTVETRAALRGAVMELMQVTVARRPDLEQEQLFALSALYDDAMQQALRGAQRSEALSLAGRFSREELAALFAFVESRDGREALRETGIPGDGFEQALRREIDRAQVIALERYDTFFD